MMMDVFYESGAGKVISLTEWPFWMQTGDILDWKWTYVTANNRIKNFKQSVSKKTVTLTVAADSKESYHENLNLLHEIFEGDIRRFTPGKLYVGQSYLECFIYASTKSEWEADCMSMDVKLELVTDAPMWITEQTVEVKRLDASARDSGGDKDYPYLYPYSYRNIETAYPFTVDHYTDSDFRLTVYGPTTSVYVTIAGHPYEVAYPTGPGEKLIIDSRASQDPQRRIYLVGRDGTCVNVFRYRGEEDVFQKIPSGNVWIEYGREYDISLTLYKERSEPLWN